MWPRTNVLTTMSRTAFNTAGCVSSSVSISSPLRTENGVSRDDGRRPGFRNVAFLLHCIHSLCFLTEGIRSVPVREITAALSETNTEPSNSVRWRWGGGTRSFKNFRKNCGIATDYGLDGPGLNPGGDEIFRTCPGRPWGPPSLLYNGYRFFYGGRGGRGMGLTPTSAEGRRKR